MTLQREIAAVAGPHAVDHAVSEAAGFAGWPLIAEQAQGVGVRTCLRGQRLWSTSLEAAEQGLEQALGRSRLCRAREAKRQCGEQNAARTTDRAAIGDSHGGLPTPGTAFRGVLVNAALQKQLQSAASRSRDRMGSMAANVARSGKRKVTKPFFP